MQRQLDALHLDYEFVDAIDKYDLHSPKYRSELGRTLDFDSTRVRVEKRNAATLSHLKAYNLMIERNEPVACILEDDAVLSPDFPEILSASQKVSWDILLLSSQSASIRRILACDIDVQNMIEEFPNRDYSLFPILRHTKWYRRISPPLSGSQSCMNWAVVPQVGWWLLMFLSISGNFHRLSRCFAFAYRYILTKSRGTPRFDYTAFRVDHTACKIGGLPIRSSQKILYGAYDIAIPAEIPLSAMGYLVSLEIAHKWKHSIIKSGAITTVDCVPWHLHNKYGISLKLVTPPCITISPIYSKMSARSS